MAETSIEWTDMVWNPTTGCDRVSPGCDNCYALTMAARLKAMGQAKYERDGDPRTSGPGFGLTVHPDEIDAPLHWRKPRRVFVNSMSDLFHAEVPEDFIARVFATMAQAPQHAFQVLTKRPQRMAAVFDGGLAPEVEVSILDDHPRAPLTADGEDYLIPGVWDEDGMAWPLPNVWLGTSIESNRYAFRADHLRATPAAVRWISAEPLLGPLDELDLTGIDWLVAGGESGPRARPMHPDWVRDLRDRCGESGVAFFFKQWGAWWPAAKCHPDHENEAEQDAWDRIDVLAHHLALESGGAITQSIGGPEGDWCDYQPDSSAWWMQRVGKKAAGRELDGRTHDEFPEVAA